MWLNGQYGKLEMISNIIIFFYTIEMKQMLKIELKSITALITKSLLQNKNIGKLLFESLQTNLA